MCHPVKQDWVTWGLCADFLDNAFLLSHLGNHLLHHLDTTNHWPAMCPAHQTLNVVKAALFKHPSSPQRRFCLYMSTS